MIVIELYHHGVKGQKWGVRRGPPYPLDAKKSRKNDESYVLKAKKFKKTKDSSSGYSTYSGFDNRYASVTPFKTSMGVSGYSFRSDSPIRWIQKAEQAGKNNPFAKSVTKFVTDDDIRLTNPFYKKMEGTINNCTKCAAALEMRKRGYDVQAGFIKDSGDSKSFTDWFDGATREVSSWSSLVKTLNSYGSGASGVLDGRYPGGGGHELHWSVLPNRSIQVEDGQCGRKFESLSSAARYYGFDLSKGVGHSRLDDKKPNWTNMNRDSVLRIEPWVNPTGPIGRGADLEKSISKIMKRLDMADIDDYMIKHPRSNRIIDTATKQLYGRL